MTKSEFVYTLLANNLTIFQNPQAMRANVRDMLKTAEGLYEVIQEELTPSVVQELKPRQSKK